MPESIKSLVNQMPTPQPNERGILSKVDREATLKAVAELHAGGALLGRAGRGQDARSESTRELDGRGADSARAAMDQQDLAGAQRAALEDVGPDREEGLGQRRRLYRVEAARDREALDRGNHAIFRVAAAAHKRTDAVSHGPGRDAVAQRVDRSGQLEARYVRGAGR